MVFRFEANPHRIEDSARTRTLDAVARKSLPAIKLLHRHGFPMDTVVGDIYATTPIHLTADRGNTEMVETLINYGALARGIDDHPPISRQR